jgi:transcription elongation factor GreA
LCPFLNSLNKNMSQELFITQERLDQLKKELGEFEAKRPVIALRIKEAKDLGDLSENAEYQEAREDQAFIEGRILEIEEMIRSAVVVTGKDAKDSTTVMVGSVVTVSSPDGEKTFTIVGSQEADPATGKISNESPLGRSLMGLSKNEKTTVKLPKGDVEYMIKKIQ